MSGTVNGSANLPCDLSLSFGGDLSIDATGDIAVSTGTQFGQERTIRRLLTNPGGYIWNLRYGAGLARFLGRPAAGTRISALARAQMALETAVSQNPAPVCQVSVGKDGTVSLSIQYVDSTSGSTQVLSLPVGG